MTTKAEFALLWANGKTFGEIYDLMEAEIAGKIAAAPSFDVFRAAVDSRITRPQDFMPGDRVRYDDSVGGVIERIASTRPGSDDYLVQWDAGPVSKVWGSDLVRASEPHPDDDINDWGDG